MNKRGCIYCLDHIKRKAEPDSTKKSLVCIHDECPYHELDPYKTYNQYLKSERSTKSLKQILAHVFDIEKKGESL
jgi:hypothetical protein